MKLSFKVGIAISLATCLMVTSVAGMAKAEASQQVKVYYKGIQIKTDVAPFIDANNRTQLPLRIISETMKDNVVWEPTTKTATVSTSAAVISIKLNANIIKTSTGNITMDTEAIIKSGRTFLPIKYVGEALGCTVTFDAPTKSVYIDGAPVATPTTSAITTLPSGNKDVPTPTIPIIAADAAKCNTIKVAGVDLAKYPNQKVYLPGTVECIGSSDGLNGNINVIDKTLTPNQALYTVEATLVGNKAACGFSDATIKTVMAGIAAVPTTGKLYSATIDGYTFSGGEGTKYGAGLTWAKN